MVEPVKTRHPSGKSNNPVSRQRYDLFKSAILDVLRRGEVTYTELVDAVTKHLAGKFDGNISWHVMVVKLDLEARGTIQRTGSKPERYRRSQRAQNRGSIDE